MSLCSICNTKKIIVKDYDQHVLDLSMKGIVKAVLPYINPVVPSFTPRLKRVASRHLSPFKGRIFICRTCGYGVMENIPSDEQLANYYKNQYWAERSNITNIVFKKRYKTNSRAEHQIKFVIGDLKKNKNKIEKVLEIGAAHASSSLLLRDVWSKNQISLYVCETGKQWLSYYQQADIEIVSHYFPFKNKMSFDYIHASHWLEHVSDLNKVLSAIHKMLKKDGYVFVEVPNTEHYYWDYPQTDTPHVYFFTRESIKKLFNKYNFECTKIGEYGITFRDILKGIPAIQDAREKGSYLRALFRKI